MQSFSQFFDDSTRECNPRFRRRSTSSLTISSTSEWTTPLSTLLDFVVMSCLVMIENLIGDCSSKELSKSPPLSSCSFLCILWGDCVFFGMALNDAVIEAGSSKGYFQRGCAIAHISLSFSLLLSLKEIFRILFFCLFLSVMVCVNPPPAVKDMCNIWRDHHMIILPSFLCDAFSKRLSDFGGYAI